MRAEFAKELTRIAQKDKGVLLMVGDLGFGVFEEFIERCPAQFYDMGVAEQNLVGVAAGLAKSGKKPVAYSIIPFVTMRCFEAIRNNVCYNDTNVKIVGVGAGYDYGFAGATHHAITDIAIMRSLPNMVVVCPGDSVETQIALKAIMKTRNPTYFRLSKASVFVYEKKPKFAIGRANKVVDGDDIALFSTGGMLKTAVEVSQRLGEAGVSCRVLDMHTVKPLDEKAVLRSAEETKMVFSIEEHSFVGGLASAMSQVLAQSGVQTRFRSFALPDRFVSEVGSRGYLLRSCSLSPEQVSKKIFRLARGGLGKEPLFQKPL